MSFYVCLEDRFPEEDVWKGSHPFSTAHAGAFGWKRMVTIKNRDSSFVTTSATNSTSDS
jgi:hypothetical protein